MTPAQFETFVSQLLNLYGYTAVNPRHRIAGRGTTHQIDALGICALTPTFSYPITLLVEAKYYNQRRAVGIGVLRNFYGVLSDIKQNLPNDFILPQIVENNYVRGTSNIIGLVISTAGFSTYARSYAYAHGIFIATVNFIKKDHSLYLGNFGGSTVIIQVPGNLSLDLDIAAIRRLKLLKIDKKSKEINIENLPIQGEIRKVKVLEYINEKLIFEEKPNEVPETVFCYKYDIYLPDLKKSLITITQSKIDFDTLLTIELPKSKTYLTLEIKNTL